MCFTFSPRDIAPLFIRQADCLPSAARPASGQEAARTPRPAGSTLTVKARLGRKHGNRAQDRSGRQYSIPGSIRRSWPPVRTDALPSYPAGWRRRWWLRGWRARPRRIPAVLCLCMGKLHGASAPHVHRGKHQRLPLPVWMHWHCPARGAQRIAS